MNTRVTSTIAGLVLLAGCDSTEPNRFPNAWRGEMVYASPELQADSAATDTTFVSVYFEGESGVTAGGRVVAVLEFEEKGSDDSKCHIWFLPEDDRWCDALLYGEGAHYWDSQFEFVVLGFNVPIQPSDSTTSASGWQEYCQWSGEVFEDKWYAYLRCGDAGELKASSLFVPHRSP
ncbi:MAG: hypothetical protein F4139_13305 [Gemmatimonadetes bacterium]|nr:hypothetical protein [Gemmatimonadota bacterium]MYA63865.1 hypothetical protein [Gemmatimonadota bacterium]MYH53900.1 hypothetical protein [Gemmatimonadota bacterium]MYI47026.1 hypothetical protein [Gemmatimonadota bacterium]MYK66406.1 hypothetical protein [Gemmatimonadota bacterium]